MKIIGLDIGTKRIGVAKADTTTRIAVPEGFISVNGQEFSELARLAALNKTTVFVLGLPRSNEGNETKQSAYVREFARRLVKTIPHAKIYFQDESLTSVEAENRLKSRKKHYEKGEIDAESATIILQDCIERMTSTPTAPSKAPARSAAQAASLKPLTKRPAPKTSSKYPSKALEDLSKLAGASNASPNRSAVSAAPVASDAPNTVDSTDSPKKKGKTVRKKKTGKIIAILAAVVVSLAGITAGGGWIWYNSALKPVVSDIECRYATTEEQAAAEATVPESCAFIHFSVESSQSVGQIGQNLESAGLVRSALAFQILARLEGKSGSLQAGDYELRPVMSTAAILDAIASGRASGHVFNLTILPGETVANIKKRLVSLDYDTAEVESAFEKRYDHKVLKGLYDGQGVMNNQSQPRSVQLEGYLYGETYQFYKGESVENIITRAMDELESVVTTNDLEAKFKAQGLTLREGIILASIVQKEASSDDMSGVAQVFLNRLAHGIMLGSDVTAAYAADLTDPDRLTLTDNAAVLANDSLYNTRRHSGLPPGPISNPSFKALLAVANPDASHRHDLYFLTGDDGMMYYSDTEQGHLQNIQNHCQQLCNAAL